MRSKGLFGLGIIGPVIYLAGAIIGGYFYSKELDAPVQNNSRLFLFSLLAFGFACCFLGDLYVRFRNDKTKD